MMVKTKPVLVWERGLGRFKQVTAKLTNKIELNQIKGLHNKVVCGKREKKNPCKMSSVDHLQDRAQQAYGTAHYLPTTRIV